MGILENLRLSYKLDGNRDLLLAVRNLYSKYVIILLFFFFLMLSRLQEYLPLRTQED